MKDRRIDRGVTTDKGVDRAVSLRITKKIKDGVYTTGYEPFVPQGKKFFVYVGGPISKGDWDSNMVQATRAFNMFVYAGLTPISPHATTLLGHTYVSERVTVANVDDYNFWLAYDFTYLRDVAHAMLRMPGESWGTDREEEYMVSMGKMVFETVEEVFDFAERQGFEVNREAALNWVEGYDAVHQQATTA